jgi:acetylornithine/succinyldiaminopimelate/putrescine aminotransferase
MHTASSVFVCNSGSKANKTAIKFARKVEKVVEPTARPRPAFLARAATGQEAPSAPRATGPGESI